MVKRQVFSCQVKEMPGKSGLEPSHLMPQKPAQKIAKRRSAADQDKLIVEALRGAGRPVSAYELIEQVRGSGVTAPPTIYRALQRLIDDGLAHRLESLNAFVACNHPHHLGKAVFAICDACGAVEEFDSAPAIKTLQTWAKGADFQVRSMTLELRGTCKACAAGNP
ncbi:MAG: Fur family transcriptional regulator [Hyphomicrobium sp.]